MRLSGQMCTKNGMRTKNGLVVIGREIPREAPYVKLLAMELGQGTKRPVLRPASFDDYDEIAALEEANGLSSKPREQWLHLWQNNPAYQQRPGWPIGWVLEDENGRIVGSLQNVPCLYRFDGRTWVGLAADGPWMSGIGRSHFC
jgi:hypothetical protein